MGVTTPNGESSGRQPTMSDKKFELSRRNALIGLGTVGVASAGAGIGTSAFFSDQEEFTDNTIQAGEFGLSVVPTVKNIDQDGGPDEDFHFEMGEEGDGLAAYNPIDIADAKPGDEYEFCWDIEVHDNPGYVAAAGDYTDEDGSPDVSAEDLFDTEELETLGETATAKLTTEYPVEEGTETATVEYNSGEPGGLGSFLSSLDGGITVSDDSGTPIEFHPSEEDDEWVVTVCLEITIPAQETGNEIQGAQLDVDMLFYAEQARHNEPGDVEAEAVSVMND